METDRSDALRMNDPADSMAADFALVSVMVTVPMLGWSTAESTCKVNVLVFVPIVVLPFFVTQVIVHDAVLDVAENWAITL